MVLESNRSLIIPQLSRTDLTKRDFENLLWDTLIKRWLSQYASEIRTKTLLHLARTPYQSLSVFDWWKDYDILRSLFKIWVIDVEWIDRAINISIANFSLKLLELHNNKDNIMPDHTFPEVFAYGIYNNIYTDKEIKSIRFDHGDTSETFVKSYYEADLVEKLRHKVLGIGDLKQEITYDI